MRICGCCSRDWRTFCAFSLTCNRTIRLSPSAEKVPGIASFITELLYRNGVSILDAFLSYEDVILIVQERLGPKAYQVLSEKISE